MAAERGVRDILGIRTNISISENENIVDRSVRRRETDSEWLSSSLSPHVLRPDSSTSTPQHPSGIWYITRLIRT